MKTSFTVLFAGLTLLLAACTKQESQAGAPAKPRVALVMKSLANEFFGTMAAGAKAHQAAHAADYDLVSNGIKNETDLAEQVGIVEQMIAMRVSAMVIAPADSKALVPVLKRALTAGIVVINIDNRLDVAAMEEAGIKIPFVGPDNRSGAAAVGRAVATRLAKGDEVAIIEGIVTADNGRQRRLGFEDAVKETGLNLVSVQSGQWEMEKANTIANALLSAYPNLKAIFCGNDNMALGAIAAIKSAGREGRVLVAGFDNIQAARTLLQSGQLAATADQHGDQLAVFGIEAAMAALKTGEVADRATPVDLVTR
jgi:ribose transport system substrate-binding protein